MAPIDFRYLFCEQPCVWPAAPTERAKGRKWEKWEKEGVWRRVLGQKSQGDYSPLSDV